MLINEIELKNTREKVSRAPRHRRASATRVSIGKEINKVWGRGKWGRGSAIWHGTGQDHLIPPLASALPPSLCIVITTVLRGSVPTPKKGLSIRVCGATCETEEDGALVTIESFSDGRISATVLG